MRLRNSFTQSELTEFYSHLQKKMNTLRETEDLHQDAERRGLGPETFDESAPTRFHQADQANQVEEQERMSNLVGHELKEMEEIEDAMKRIDKGEYGFCGSCNKEISAARLKQIPEARYCLTCEMDEEKVKSLGSHKSFQKRADFNSKDVE